MTNNLETQIFQIKNSIQFEDLALKIFRFQSENIPVYGQYIKNLSVNTKDINHVKEIPFMPIDFFKTHKIIADNSKHKQIFTSSGTSGLSTSKHYVTDISLYEDSFRKGFDFFYGDIEDYCILALLPSYLERKGSSLIYMAADMIKKSRHPDSGFYLHNIDELAEKLLYLNKTKQKTILLGVTYALLDLVEKYKFLLDNTIVMETGGMKGKRKEIIREKLHETLTTGLGVKSIHSEYGMTELLSQAYSKGNGIFLTPPWMKIFIRDTYDPLTLIQKSKSGGINIVDLANINSCSFIETKDLGKIHKEGGFEVLGRFDNSDVRGCNLLVAE
ncbi:MAG: acyl transferase [Bacteroidetes bacterium]|nr:acyl transferase [Bacteroidota bacterium]